MAPNYSGPGPNFLKVVREISERPSLDGRDLKHRKFLRDAENGGYVEYRPGKGWNLTAYGRERIASNSASQTPGATTEKRPR